MIQYCSSHVAEEEAEFCKLMPSPGDLTRCRNPLIVTRPACFRSRARLGVPVQPRLADGGVACGSPFCAKAQEYAAQMVLGAAACSESENILAN